MPNRAPATMTDPIPRAQSDRIVAIDALRGFALIGIFLVNIVWMGGLISTQRPAPGAGAVDIDWVVWWLSNLFFFGSMRGLFSILFGASALLFLASGGREMAFLRRCAWLFCFGAINGTLLLWPGDILMIYALAGPLLLLLRNATPRRLLTIAAALLALLSVWSYIEVAGSLPKSPEKIAAAIAAEQQVRLGGYLTNLAFMARKSLYWLLDISEISWVLDAAALMLVGLALMRLGVLDGRARPRIYVMLLLIGLVIGLPIRLFEVWSAWTLDGFFPPLTWLSLQFGRLAMALGWIGAFMLFWQMFPWRAVFLPFAALGRMALTCYLAQSLSAAVIYSGFGLGLWNQLGWLQCWAIALAIMAALAIVSMLWLERFTMGPAEWLWRRLTFGWERPVQAGKSL